MAMDRMLRADVCREVKAAITQYFESVEEEWLSEKEVLKQFQMFSHDWIKRYGYTLPRTRIIVTSEADGKTRQSPWAYGKNQLQRMIMENKIQKLKVRAL